VGGARIWGGHEGGLLLRVVQIGGVKASKKIGGGGKKRGRCKKGKE